MYTKVNHFQESKVLTFVTKNVTCRKEILMNSVLIIDKFLRCCPDLQRLMNNLLFPFGLRFDWFVVVDDDVVDVVIIVLLAFLMQFGDLQTLSI